MSPEMKAFALIMAFSVLLVAAAIRKGLYEQKRIRRRVAMSCIIRQWDAAATRLENPNKMIRTTLSTAASLMDAGRHQDALEVLDWLWSDDDVPMPARVCGLRAMALAHYAKGNHAAGLNHERWAETLSRSNAVAEWVSQND